MATAADGRSHHENLMAAVASGRSRDAAHHARACARMGILDLRYSPASSGINHFAGVSRPHLVGLPHHLLSYRAGAEAVLEELLVAGVDGDLIDRLPHGWCLGNDECCAKTGPTALQLACAKFDLPTVRMLLQFGARADLPMCFEVDEEDAQPSDTLDKYDKGASQTGIAGFSALRLARHRGLVRTVTVLEEHGASSIDTSAHPTSECPICYEALSAQSVVTTPCAHRFHAACLPAAAVKNCPLCRTPLWQETAESKSDPHQRVAIEDDIWEDRPPPSQLHDGISSARASSQSIRSETTTLVCGDAGTPTEPPWLRSPVWVRSAERTYSEIERRRL